jgi:hypothetical protein
MEYYITHTIAFLVIYSLFKIVLCIQKNSEAVKGPEQVANRLRTLKRK